MQYDLRACIKYDYIDLSAEVKLSGQSDADAHADLELHYLHIAFDKYCPWQFMGLAWFREKRE